MIRGLALALLLASLAGTGARAETRTIEGDKLILNTSRSADTVISTDPSLSGHVRVSLDGDLSCLSTTGTSAGAILTASGCSEEAGTLRVDVPPNMALIITAGGEGELHLGDTDGSVVLELNGSGDVAGGRTGRLVLGVHGNSDVNFHRVQGGAVLEMTGSGDVRIGTLGGDLTLKHTGNGDLAIGHIDAGSATLESTGSGDMLLGAGSIGSLVAHLQGHGDLGVAAEVHNGEVRAYGGGDVKLGKITGALNRSSGDNSEIYVGGPAVVDTVIGQVAKAISNGQKGDTTVVMPGVAAVSLGGHVLTLVLAGIILFIVVRMVQRRGGVAGLRAAARPRPATGPSHPGVMAVCDTMARLEERLGRVEQYVTSREFDLQQKFRKL